MQEGPTARRSGIAIATAAFLLVLMAALMVSSSWDDTIIFDEEPHIAAGLSYLRRADYRFNPEHPPLMKDLAAPPLLFLNLKEPWNDPSWEAGDAWSFGAKLLYDSGNDPDAIMRAARAPMIVFTIAFGWFLFWWTRRHFSNGTALLALFFYTFSPTFLAHGRFVTTDVGAATGLFVATVAFLRFVRNPSPGSLLLAGLAAGFALLTKFSTILFVPVAILLTIAWLWLPRSQQRRPFRRVRWMRRGGGFVLALRWPGSSWLKTMSQFAAVVMIAFAIVYLFYLHHTWNYPAERQLADTKQMLLGRGVGHTPKDITIWAADKSLARPMAFYWAGLFQAVQRTHDEQTRFFLGQIYSTGLPLYFPFVFLVKEPLALHLCTLLAVAFALSRFRGPLSIRAWLRDHFSEFAFLAVIVVYWATSISSDVNIGVRHVLPAFPFLFVLVANQIAQLFHRLRERAVANPPHRVWMAPALLAALLVWQAVSVLRVHPSYLAYFNELAGGPDGGWRYVVDSNIDWGQDLKRLAEFVDQRGITEIHLDYFGTALPSYYLKEKYRGFSSCNGPQKGWVAVSAMAYQHSRQRPECDYRNWLPIEKLVTKIGYSIFVFQVD